MGWVVSFWLYARHTNRQFFQVADFFAPAFPIGLGAGRIVNFINGDSEESLEGADMWPDDD